MGALAAGQELGRWDGYGANEEEERFDDSATLYFVPAYRRHVVRYMHVRTTSITDLAYYIHTIYYRTAVHSTPRHGDMATSLDRSYRQVHCMNIFVCEGHVVLPFGHTIVFHISCFRTSAPLWEYGFQSTRNGDNIFK